MRARSRALPVQTRTVVIRVQTMGKPEKQAEVGFFVARARSFAYAFRGLARLFREPNARVHALATVLVLGLGLFLHLAALEWGALVFAIVLVLAAEAFNTAVESLADAAVPEQHALVRDAKDLAAAGVLLAALGAVVIAVLVLGPHLVELQQKPR